MEIRNSRQWKAPHGLALAAAVAWSAVDLQRTMQPAPEFDAQHVYLPLARALLQQGPAALSDPATLAVAPFSFTYMALLGANVGAIKVAGIVLFLALLALAARIGTLAHSALAGVAAAGLLALSPLVKPYMATALTEPPYLFLVGLWLWALLEDEDRPRKAWIALGATALGLALVTRPTYLYFAPAVAIGAALAWKLARHPAVRARAGRLALLHALALVPAGLVIFHHAATFGVPAIAVGAGNALYYGSHVLTEGQEPPYYGLGHDGGAVLEGITDRIEGERRLRATALAALADTPLATLAALHAKKLAAFLLVTPAETVAPPARLRAWRIVLLLLAAYGLWAMPRRYAMALGAILLYQAAIHAPLLYVHRYSVGAIDLPLALAAGIGLAHAATRLRHLLALVAMASLAAAAGTFAMARSEPPSPRIDDVPHLRAWALDPKALETAATHGLARAPDGAFAFQQQGGWIELPVRDAPLLHPWDNSVLSLTLQAEGACRDAFLAYRKAKDEALGAVQKRRLPEGTTRLVLGAALTMGLNTEGTLRIFADCDAGARLRIVDAWIAAPRYAGYYRDRALGRPQAPGLLLPGR